MLSFTGRPTCRAACTLYTQRKVKEMNRNRGQYIVGQTTETRILSFIGVTCSSCCKRCNSTESVGRSVGRSVSQSARLITYGFHELPPVVKSILKTSLTIIERESVRISLTVRTREMFAIIVVQCFLKHPYNVFFGRYRSLSTAQFE